MHRHPIAVQPKHPECRGQTRAKGQRRGCRHAAARDRLSARHYDPQHGRQKHEQRQHRRPQPRARRSQQFRVAHTHPVASSQQTVAPRNATQAKVSAGRTQRMRRHRNGFQQPRNRQSGQQQRQRQHIGQQQTAPVDPGEREQCPSEQAVDPDPAGPDPAGIAIRQNRPGHHGGCRQFDHRMEAPDRRAAMPASPALHRIAQQRHQFVPRQPGAARSAGRTPEHHRLLCRQPHHQHAQKAAGERCQNQRRQPQRRQTL